MKYVAGFSLVSSAAEAERIASRKPAKPRGADSETQGLAIFVRNSGGIRPDKSDLKRGKIGGELAYLTVKEGGLVGLVNRNAGRNAEQMAQWAFDAGYFPEYKDYTEFHQNVPPGEFLRILRDEPNRASVHNRAYADIEKSLEEQEFEYYERQAQRELENTPLFLGLPEVEEIFNSLDFTEENVKLLKEQGDFYGIREQTIESLIAHQAEAHRAIQGAESDASDSISGVSEDVQAEAREAVEELIDETEPDTDDVDLSFNFGANSEEKPTDQPKPAQTSFDQTDLFGNKVSPKTEQTDLFGGMEGESDTVKTELETAYGRATADYLLSLEKSSDKDLSRAAREMIEARKLVAAKGAQSKQIVEDAADALDLFASARQSKSTVEDILNQPRLDAARVSGRAADFARMMEAGRFAGAFNRALSEAKTETSEKSEKSDFEPGDTVRTKSGELFEIVSITGDKANLYSLETGNEATGVPLKSLQRERADVMKSVAGKDAGEINLENLYNADGEVNYEQVSIAAERVVSGIYQIIRLDREGERGRIEGGPRSVEASLLIGAKTSADQASGSRERKAEEERILEDYARKAGIWFDHDALKQQLTYLAQGTEAKVYEDINPAYVIKFAPIPSVLGDETASSALRFFDDKIALHNALPMTAPYELVGFTRDKNGTFLTVLRQPFIRGGETVQLEDEFAKQLQTEARLLLDHTGWVFSNNRITVHDIVSHNVVKDSAGRYHIIDPLITFTDESAYQPFSVASNPNNSGEINLKNLYNKEGEFDYDRIKQIAGRVVSGESKIQRLNEQEERGRILGGRRNVEATIISQASESASRAQSKDRRTNAKERNERVEKALEQYARREGVWFEFDAFARDYTFLTKRTESYVYFDENENQVYKLTDYDYGRYGTSPAEFIDNQISLFNYLFPETAYELVGFTRDSDGRFRFIRKQPFIKGKPAHHAKVKAFMKRVLGKTSEAPTSHQFFSPEYHVWDLHPDNIYEDEGGNLYVIDAFVELNTPNRYLEGTREYESFSIKQTSEETESGVVMKSVAAPMFRKRDPETENLLTDILPRTPTEDLLPDIKTWIQGKNLEFSPAASEFFRRLIADYNRRAETPFDGAFLKPENLRALLQHAEKKLEEAAEAGYTEEETIGIRELIDNLKTVAEMNKNTAVVYTYDDALPEEEFHREDYLAGGTDAQAAEIIKQSELWKAAQNPDGLFFEHYGTRPESEQISELVAKLATGQFAKYGFDRVANHKAEAESLLNEWADGVLRKNKIDTPEKFDKFIKDFQRIGQYANFKTSHREGTGASGSRRQAQKSGGAEQSDAGRRSSDIQPETAAAGRDQRADLHSEEERLNSLRQSETEAAEQVKNRRYARTLRETGRDAEDVPYVPDTEKEWIAAASQIISDSIEDDYRSAIEKFRTGDINEGVKTALGIALIDHLGSIGDYARMREIASETVVHVGTAAQALRASQLAAKYDFAHGVQLAQKAKEKTGKPLTDKEIDALRERLSDYAESEETRAFYEYALSELKEEKQLLETEINDLTKALDEAERRNLRQQKSNKNLSSQIAYWKAEGIVRERKPHAGKPQNQLLKELQAKREATIEKLQEIFRQSADVMKSVAGRPFSLKTNFIEGLKRFLRGELRPHEAIVVTATPEILTRLGVEPLDIIITQQTLTKILKDKHNEDITPKLVSKLPSQLSSPVAVFDYTDARTNEKGFTLLTALKTDRGRFIVAGIKPGKDFQGYTVNRLETVHAKDYEKTFERWTEKGGLRFVNKTKSQIHFPSFGSYLTTAEKESDLLKNILTETDFVKDSGGDVMKSAASAPLTEEAFEALRDLTAIDILEYKTVEEIYQNIDSLTAGKLTDVQKDNIFLEAFEMTETARSSGLTDKAREKIRRRQEYRKKIKEIKSSSDYEKLSRFDFEVIALGNKEGLSNEAIAGAILLPRQKTADAVRAWKKAMKEAFPDTEDKNLNRVFKESVELGEKARREIKRKQLEARKERENLALEIEEINELRLNALAKNHQARMAVERYYRHLSRSFASKTFDAAVEAFNITKGLKATGEISYVLRQGFLPLLTDTRAALRGDWEGVTHGLLDNAERIEVFSAKVREHKRFLEAQRLGVRFTQIGEFNVADDHFNSRLLEKIPLYRRAEVAYTLPGDLQRLYLYDNFARLIEEQNLSPREAEQAKRYAARVVNAFTGKGDIAGVMTRGGTFSKLLNMLCFSPSLLISRFQSAAYLSPVGVALAPKGMRMQMAKKSLRVYSFFGLLAVLLGMNLDPEDDDFGKIKVRKGSPLEKLLGEDARDMHFDVMAGLNVPAQLAMRIAGGLVKSVIKGDGAYFTDAVSANWRDTVAAKTGEPRFLRGKLSPSAALIYNQFSGTDYIGRPVTRWGATADALVPLSWAQVYDALVYDRHEAMMKEPVTFERAKTRLKENKKKYANAALTLAVTFLGGGMTQYPKNENTPAVQKAQELSPAVSKKDAETLRVEGGLRKLLQEKFALQAEGASTAKVDREIEKYALSYNAGNKQIKKLAGQAKDEFGLLKYYASTLTDEQIERVLPLADDRERAELQKILKARQKKDAPKTKRASRPTR